MKNMILIVTVGIAHLALAVFALTAQTRGTMKTFMVTSPLWAGPIEVTVESGPLETAFALQSATRATVWEKADYLSSPHPESIKEIFPEIPRAVTWEVHYNVASLWVCPKEGILQPGSEAPREFIVMDSSVDTPGKELLAGGSSRVTATCQNGVWIVEKER